MFTFSLLGCNKEEPFQSDIPLESVLDEISVKDGRLSFEKTSTFELVMNNMHSKGKPHLDKSIEAIARRDGFVPFSERTTILSKSSSEEMVAEDTLILDPFFGSVINEDKEVEVNGVVYKISRYGTFFGNPLKLNRINELLVSLDSLKDNDSKGLSFVEYPEETEVADNLYQVEDGIYRYDTYPEDYYYEEPSDYAAVYTPPPANIAGEALPESFYDNLTTFPFDAHTIVGEIIESLFGRSRAHNIYFSDTRRVRVNFYSVNYVVYSAIGMNVKMQKKNWIGWSETDAQEIRMGWDGMVYEYKHPYYYSGNTPKRTELTKTPGVNDKLAFTVNILST